MISNALRAAWRAGLEAWRAEHAPEQPPAPPAPVWEQPLPTSATATDARCIQCGKTFPGVEPPSGLTLYCHTECFTRWKAQMTPNWNEP